MLDGAGFLACAPIGLALLSTPIAVRQKCPPSLEGRLAC